MIHICYNIDLFNKNWEILPDGLDYDLIDKHNKNQIFNLYKQIYCEKYSIEKYKDYMFDGKKGIHPKLTMRVRVPFKLLCANIIACLEKYSYREWIYNFDNETTENDFWNNFGIILDRVNILRSLCFRDYGKDKAPFRTLVWNHAIVINKKDLLNNDCLGINPRISNIDRNIKKLQDYQLLGKFAILTKSWSELELHLCYPNKENYEKAFSTDLNKADSPALFVDLINFYKRMFIVKEKNENLT